VAKLVLKNLYKRYPNKRNKEQNDFAVRNFSLECDDGEFVGILGPSGCGKTTTLRMIAGLEEITAGDIFICDARVNDLHPKDRRIGLAFEDYALYPPLNVYDNIAFNLRAKGVSETNIRAEIMRIAPLLKIDDLLGNRPVSLSGGQKQRVNIARAIIRKPQLLLLDEPLSHLDGKMRQVLRTEIKRLHKEINCTTIIVTHDQLEAMSLADRIAIMQDGQLQQYGTPLEVYNNPVNEFVAGFIGEPPMNILTVIITESEGRFFFTFQDNDFRIAVPEDYYPVVRSGMTVRLGIRPTDLLISPQEKGSAAVRVAVFENLGEECRVSIKAGEEFLTLTTTDEIRYRPGDIIRLEVKAGRTYLFDPVSGDRIWGESR